MLEFVEAKLLFFRGLYQATIGTLRTSRKLTFMALVTSATQPKSAFDLLLTTTS